MAEDGTSWLRAACAAVLERLADGSELSAQQLREEVPELAGRVEVAPDKAYGGNFPIAPRVLDPAGRRGPDRARPQQRALAHVTTGLDADGAVAGGVAAAEPGRRRAGPSWSPRWLRTFGPGTAADVQWWLGATAGIVRQALADTGAVEVSLDGGSTGWVLPDDLVEEPPVASWAALLPVLDPTVMGWKERDFYLGGHGAEVFDRNGNAGTTAWWDGRVVGCWVQDEAGDVRVHLLEEVDAAGRVALEVEAQRLTAWLDGAPGGHGLPVPRDEGGNCGPGRVTP